MKRLDLNAKKIISGIFKFRIKTIMREKDAKFRKIQIFRKSFFRKIQKVYLEVGFNRKSSFLGNYIKQFVFLVIFLSFVEYS